MACLYGAALARHTEVTLLGTWEQGIREIREHGIRVESPEGTEVAQVDATSDPSQISDVRHALVLVKSWQTETAAERLVSALAEDGLALTLQNGLGNLEILQRVLGPERAALGVTTAGATLLGPGRVRPGGRGEIYLPDLDHLGELRSLFTRADFEVKLEENLEGLVWAKLAVNAGINPLTALLRVRNGALLDIADAREVLEATVAEVAEVVSAGGVQMAWDDPVSQTLEVARRTAENRSSMLQDVARGAPTEIDAICGAVVRRGEELGIPTPVNRTLWRLVRAAVAEEALVDHN